MSTPSTIPARLFLTIIKFTALTASMYFIPTFMHSIVRSLDDVYELLGRRAQTTEVSWLGLGIATVVLAAWHVWLGRMSYVAVGRGKGWGKVLGRIVLPVAIGAMGLGFGYAIWERALWRREDGRRIFLINHVASLLNRTAKVVEADVHVSESGYFDGDYRMSKQRATAG
ncbi:hypothetical protein IQ06DRAFT_303666 [Phaeosphaeriaceae sp. SRC1lsM3a]|nr:hypothetical protein IQ06DRAFT_303666 [Stagonospora sp. SRC1lsM3a]